MKEYKFTNSFNDTLYGHSWEIENAKKVVIIVTGMAEHSARYDNFAQFLNKNGFSVYCLDHYGQGKNGKLGCGGPDFFHRFEKTVDELVLKYKKKDVKVYIFSHSMGSFITQGYIEDYGKADKVIICGSNYIGGLGKLGLFVANLVCNKKNWDKPAGLLNDMAIGAYEKATKGLDSKNGWLSYNQENYKAYDKDKLSGYHCSNGFYHDFFYGLSSLCDKKNFLKIRKDLPILIIAGHDDPVGNYSKGPTKLYKVYRKLGLNAKCIIYDKMKHEILNETDNKKVYNDILDFYK